MEAPFVTADKKRAQRNFAQRRKRFPLRAWKTSRQGNLWLVDNGIHVVIYQQRTGTWSYRVEDMRTGRSLRSAPRFESMREAMLAAFDVMVVQRDECGWGKSE